LVSLYLALTYPETFGKAAVLSPSVWWGDRAVLRTVEALEATPPLRIWLDAGTNEGGHMLHDARLLRDALAAKGFRDLSYTEIDGAPHNESAWADRVGAVLRFLFPARP